MDLSTSSFKSSIFNLEKYICTILHNSKHSDKEIFTETLGKCDRLTDALFQKKLSLMKKLSERNTVNLSDDLSDFLIAHNKLTISKSHLNELSHPHSLLKEKKLLHQVLKIILELRNGYFDKIEETLNAIARGNLDNAISLSYALINYSGHSHKKTNSNESEYPDLDEVNLNRVLAYKEQFLNQISSTLVRSLKEKTPKNISLSVKILDILDKKQLAIDSFLDNSDIFTSFNVNDLVFEQNNTINLDFFDCNGPFYRLIEEIKSVYEDEFKKITLYYDLPSNNIIHKSLGNVLSLSLSKYLKNCDILEYVFALYHSYNHLISLKEMVNEDVSFSVREIFNKPLQGISKKEIQALDEVLAIFNGNEDNLQKKYIFMGISLKKSESESDTLESNLNLSQLTIQNDNKPNKPSSYQNAHSRSQKQRSRSLRRTLVLKLIMLYDYFEQRNELFKYDNLDYFSIKKHYLHSIERFILKDINLYSLSTFKELCDYFFILKRIALESKVLKEKLETIFYNYLNDRHKEIKVIISHSFNPSDQDRDDTASQSVITRLCLMIQTEYRKIKKHIKGCNGDYMIRNIINKAAQELSKHILKQKISVKYANKLYIDLKELLHSLKRIKITDTPLNKLKNNLRIVLAEKEQLKLYVTKNDPQIKKWLKARKDYSDIKNIANES